MKWTAKSKAGFACIFVGLFGGIGSTLSGMLSLATGIAAIVFWVLLGLILLFPDLRFHYLLKKQRRGPRT